MHLYKYIFIIIFSLVLPLMLQSQTWQSEIPLNTPRVGACAVVWGNSLFVFGGKTNDNRVLNTVEKFDLNTATWDTLTVPHFTYGRYNASAIVFRDKIYLIGGRNNTEVFKEVEIYDPVQNSWTIAQELRKRRESHTAVIFNDTLTVLGGIEGQYQYVDEIEWYDETEEKWEERDSSIVEGRAAAFISTSHDNLYLCGGTYFGLKESSAVADTNFVWNYGPSMQTGRSYGGMVHINDYLFMIGGETNSGVSNLVEVYNPHTWTIEQGINLPTPRSGIAAVAKGDTIYAIGGWSVNHYQILNTVEYLLPPLTNLADQYSQNIPTQVSLIEGFPNPFNGVIQFRVEIFKSDQFELQIFDISGRLVATIFKGRLTPGLHNFQWDASNTTGLPVASGIYLTVLKNNTNFQKLKIIYVK